MSHDPDFQAAAEGARWTGDLAGLWRALHQQLAESPDAGRWVWRVLPRGACVALRRGDGGAFECRISRRTKPATGKESAWRFEIDVFRERFGIESWTEHSTLQRGGIAALFCERRGLGEP